MSLYQKEKIDTIINNNKIYKLSLIWIKINIRISIYKNKYMKVIKKKKSLNQQLKSFL